MVAVAVTKRKNFKPKPRVCSNRLTVDNESSMLKRN